MGKKRLGKNHLAKAMRLSQSIRVKNIQERARKHKMSGKFEQRGDFGLAPKP
jgi:hypothetical protein